MSQSINEPISNPTNPGGSLSGIPAVKLNRTCQGCKIRKIKCVYDDSAAQCQRCGKFSLSCVFEAPAIRKKRNRNENRIRDLERKIEDLQAVVAKDNSTSVSSLSESVQGTDQEQYPRQVPEESTEDPITQGLLSTQDARSLYNVFYYQYAPLYPLVSPPPPQIWGHVRAEQPALFRAALTAASSSVRPELWERLFKDTERYLVHETMILGHKSLHLIQATLILAAWNHPPKTFQNLTFSHMINMAATMVMDLRSSNESDYKIPSSKNSLPTSSDNLVELCRTFLATYFLCSSVAISFRRPSVLRYGSWVADCLRVLEAVPNPSLNDERLVAWTRLHRLAEESLTIVGFEDEPHIDISDIRNQFIIKRCIEQIQEWKRSTADILINGAIEIHYYMILLVLHEPALYGSYHLSDFRPPYAIRRATIVDSRIPSESLHAQEQSKCLAQGLLQSFLAYTDEALRQLPVIIFVRMMHAVVVLIKLDSTVHTSHQGESITTNIIESIIRRLDAAAQMEAFHLPRLFHFILVRLYNWYRGLHSEHGSKSDTTIEPLMSINDEKNANETKTTGDTQMSHNDYGHHGDASNNDYQGQLQSFAALPNGNKLPENTFSSEMVPDEEVMAFMDQIFGSRLNFIAPNSWN